MQRRGFLKGATGLLGASILPALASDSAAAIPSAGEGGPEDEAFWSRLRDQFPLTHHRIYLNTAGLGPSPHSVVEAVHRRTVELEETCETGQSHELWEAVKGRAARLLGCDADELAYTRNTTEGVNIVCNGLPLKAGDEVITSTHEHVGNTIAWLARQRRDGIGIRVFEPSTTAAAENVERIRALINRRTRLLSVSHVTTATGQVLPVKEIGRLAAEHGLWYFLDGAQAAGQVPLDVHDIGCHAYATSGHKWLLGPKGTGLLYVRRDALDLIEAKWVGAHSNHGAFDMATGQFAFDPTAQRYEYGTVSVALFHGLGVALQFLLDLSMERVWARDHALGARLIAGLQGVGAEVVSPLHPDEHSAMVSFRVAGIDRSQLQTYLAEKYRIRSRGIYEGGFDAVRVSPHVFSSAADVDRVVEAVAALRA